MGDVAGTVWAVDRLNSGYCRVVLREILLQVRHELVERGALPVGRIVNLVHGLRILRPKGQHVHLDDIVDIGEVPAVLAVTVDGRGLVPHELLYKERNDGGVCPVGVLTAAEDVEVPQADILRPVGAREDIRVELVHVFGYGIGREGPADDILHLGQGPAVTVCGAAGSEDETPDTSVSRRDKHVEKAADIHGIGGYGVLDGARHRAEGGLVEDVFHAVDRLPAVLHVADVSYQETETSGVFFKQRQDVLNMSRREVVEAAHRVPFLQKMLAEVGAYESGAAGH